MKTLTWTKKKPTKPGWYWVRGRLFERSAIVVRIEYLSVVEWVDQEWAGPIPEPKERKTK